jgi:hypothetical protein
MIVGNKSAFAIESHIEQAYENIGFRALGFFIIHVGGLPYGLRELDATMLGNAFHEADRILANRGKHTAFFASEPNPGEIVNSILKAIYLPVSVDAHLFGVSSREFTDSVYASRCGWHWACGEAFDDGSSIWRFDIGDRVRIIADRSPKDYYEYRYDPETLRDVWIRADEFYEIVKQWRDAFLAEWLEAEKQPTDKQR